MEDHIRPLNNVGQTLIGWFLGASLFFSVAFASMWTDPTFEQMTSNATLIAVCEIMEDGTWAAKAKVLEVIKGERPKGPILIGGGNNQNWPQYAIEKESLRKGERYLFFLEQRKMFVGIQISKQWEDVLQEEVAKGHISTNSLPFERQRVGEWKYEEGYAMPTPSTGDYQIKTNTVYGGWRSTSYPGKNPGVPLPLATELIKGLVLHQAGQDPVAAKRRITELLQVSAVEQTETFEKDDVSAAGYQHFARLEWLLCAQAAYGDSDPNMTKVMQAAADHKWIGLNILAGKALRSLDETPASLKIAQTLLKHKNSAVQTEAARSLINGSFTANRAGLIVLAALKGSKANRREPDNIMQPIRNVSSSGTEEMVLAVTHFGLAAEAHDDFITLIRPDGLNAGVFSALSEHFQTFPSDKARDRFIDLANKAPSDSAEYFIDYFFGEKSDASLGVVQKKINDDDIFAYDRAKWLERFYHEFGIDHPILGQTLNQLASKKELDAILKAPLLSLLVLRNDPRDDATIKSLFNDSLLVLRNDRDDATIESLFNDESLKSYDLVESIQLMLLVNPESKIAEEILLQLMERDASDRELLSYGLLLPTPKVVAKLKRRAHPDSENREARKHSKNILRGIEIQGSPPASSNEHLYVWISLLQVTDWTTRDVILPQLLWVQGRQGTERLSATIRERMKKKQESPILYLEALKVLGSAQPNELEALAASPREKLIDRAWGSILQATRKRAIAPRTPTE